MNIKIAPSILSADFANLEREVRRLDEADADYIHFDVMDGHFVPNLTFGPAVIKALRSLTEKTFDVHLMVSPVDWMLQDIADAGADIITFHAEAGPHGHRTLQEVRSLGKKVGVSLNPATPITVLEPLITEIDQILIMLVNPGFGGQSMIEAQLPKVVAARQLIMQSGRDIDLEVDGGVTPDNVDDVIAAGANIIVAGTGVFKFGDGDYASNIKALRGPAGHG